MPIYKNENNNSWYIRLYVKDANGKSKQITRNNKKWIGRKGKELAQQEEIRLKNNHKQKKVEEPIKEIKEVFIDAVIDKYKNELEKYDKESTFYGHNSVIKNQIEPYFRKKDIFKITTDDIIKWHEILDRKNYSVRYKRKCHTILASILDVGRVNFGLIQNVARVVGNFKQEKEEKEKIIKEKEKLKYITFNEFKSFISHVNNPLWYTYFNLLYFTGMRKGEIQALNWNDIDFINNKIIVNKTLTVKTRNEKWRITSTKNLKNRTIDIDKNLKDILYNYFLLKKQDRTFSMDHFVLGNDEPLKQHRIDDNKKRYFKSCGIPEITNHEFRHSHVSLMINEYLKTGETDTTKFFIMMSNRLGHTIKVMQETYLHLFPDIQTPIVNLIDNLNLQNI